MLNFEGKKVLVSSHNDIDGCAPVIFCKRYAKQLNNPDVWMNGYNDEDYKYEELKNYDIIIYTDFSPNEQSRKIIQENNIECFILDHHIGVYDELTTWVKEYNKAKYTFSEVQAGTEIFYNWLKENFNILTNQTIDEFVQLVSTYDLWQKQSPLWNKAQNLNRLLYKTLEYYKSGLDKYNLFFSLITHKLDFEDHFVFNKLEQQKIDADIKKEDELFFSIVNNPKKRIITRKDELGRYFSIISLSSKISAICNRLLEKYKKLDYIIALNTFEPKDIKISLRSKDHVDLLALENVKGHKCAAGYNDTTQEIVEDIWSGKIYSLPYRN